MFKLKAIKNFNAQIVGFFSDYQNIKGFCSFSSGCDDSELNKEFNGVLLNYYRKGTDSMGWHSDNESSLGLKPLVASISLGETRRFCLRSKKNKQFKTNIDLKSGDLLVLHSGNQEVFEHSVPKQIKLNQPRINLTFRQIVPSLEHT